MRRNVEAGRGLCGGIAGGFAFWLANTIGLLLLAAGCGAPTGPGEVPWSPPATSGAMLVRHGGYLYHIGGREADGSLSARVYVAEIAESGDVGSFRPTTALPVGLANGVAFASGRILYILGGRNATGPTDEILYTLVDPVDGSLGWGHGWQRNERSLSEPRSHAALVENGGRIILVGGRTDSGEPTDSIDHAAIWPDGQIGQWYAANETLAIPAFSVGATIQDGALIVGGGASSAGPIDGLWSFAIQEHARLGSPSNLTALPEPVTSPLLFESEGSLYIAGGIGVAGPRDAVHALTNGWRLIPGLSAPAEGPHAGRIGGNLYFPPNKNQGESPAVERLSWVGIAPDEPSVHPGAGFVSASTVPIVWSEPGATVRYRTGSPGSLDPLVETVTSSDPIWDEQTVSADSDFLFRAFRPDGRASSVVGRSYRLRGTSFFVLLSGYLEVQDQPHTLRPLRLEETYHDGSTQPVNEVYYRLTIDTPASVVLTWADATDAPDGTPYDSHIETSVFESNLMTFAVDTGGFAALARRGGTTDSLRLGLGPGVYYVVFRDYSGASGTSFAAAVYGE